MIRTDFLQVILLEIFCLIVFIIYRQDFFKNIKKYNNSYFFLWIFITIFCTWFSWGHDYYNYKELLQYQTHVEQVYVTLFNLINQNYLLWRFIVWGLSSLFVIFTFRNLNTTVGLASILFILLPLLQFYCVTRNSLSLSILFYALSYIRFNSFKGWIIAISLLILAYNLHQSMPLYLCLFLFVCLIPFNKTTLIASLILFPFLKGGILMLSESFISMFSNDNFGETGISYIEDNNEMAYTTFGWIHKIFSMAPIILILYYSVRESILKNNIKKNDYTNKYLFFAYILIYMSFLFWGEGSKHLQTRFLDAAYLPLCYFLSQFLSTRRAKPIVNIFFILSLASFLWRILYNIYSF